MDTVKRMRLLRILEKMEKNPGFSDKLGIKNSSQFKSVKERQSPIRR